MLGAILENAKFEPLNKAPFNNPDYIGENKYDGIRATIIKRKNNIVILSRNGNDITEEFPELEAAARKQIKGSIQLDGEITMPGKKFSDIIGKLKSIKHTKHAKVRYHAFDVLSKEGHSVKQLPLMKRKAILKSSVGDGTVIKQTAFKQNPTKADYRKAIRKGYEGIVLKRKDSKYKPGKRMLDWVKVRKSQNIDAKVIGIKKTKHGKQSFKIVDKNGRSLGLVSSAKLDKTQRAILIREVEKGGKPWVDVQGHNVTKKHKIRHPRIVRVRVDLR
jgi:bifunctional non-homologous end joining protein LigD